ncbi:MAG: DHHW family protein [Emergencia sp.]
MRKKTADSLLGICFAAVLATVFIINLIIPDTGFSEEENRVLQDLPDFSLSSYLDGRFENRLENYTTDQFFCRNTFIKIKTSADRTAGRVESNGVYLCKDSYLMEALETPDPASTEELLTAMKSFKEKYRKLPMFFLLAPNAGGILADKLPAFVQMKDQDGAIGSFFSRITDIGFHPIDVRGTFRSHASDTQLYYRTDHHWTTDGAFLAYKEAVKQMKLTDEVSYRPYVVKNDFRGTLASKSGFANGENDLLKIYMPDKDQDYRNSVIYYPDTKTKTTEFYQLDNLDTKDAYTVFGGSNHPVYTIQTPVDTEEKLLLIKDSYANSFIPFLSQNFREIVVVDPRYYFDDIDALIKSEGITQVLFLYNANTFFTDSSLKMMLEN